jgi:hypothetical protein
MELSNARMETQIEYFKIQFDISGNDDSEIRADSNNSPQPLHKMLIQDRYHQMLFPIGEEFNRCNVIPKGTRSHSLISIVLVVGVSMLKIDKPQRSLVLYIW